MEGVISANAANQTEYGHFNICEDPNAEKIITDSSVTPTIFEGPLLAPGASERRPLRSQNLV